MVQEEFQGVEFGGEIHMVKNDTLHLNEQLIIKGEKGYLISTSETDSVYVPHNYVRINDLNFKKVGDEYLIGGEKHKDFKGKVMIDGKLYEGAGITTQAFSKYIPFSKWFLTIAVVLFAVSTMISWSYYGLQSWKFLFGRGKRSGYGL